MNLQIGITTAAATEAVGPALTTIKARATRTLLSSRRSLVPGSQPVLVATLTATASVYGSLVAVFTALFRVVTLPKTHLLRRRVPPVAPQKDIACLATRAGVDILALAMRVGANGR